MSIQSTVKQNNRIIRQTGLKKQAGSNIRIRMPLSLKHLADTAISRLTAKGRERAGQAACVIGLSLLMIIGYPAAGPGQPPLETDTPVVVIDPGHGGNDTGAKGPEGTLEKTVTLNLARLIADQLATRCRVILTRSDDYQLEIPERTAMANRSAADIFISLHTGGSFTGSISGSSVYFFQQFTESALTAEARTPKPLADGSQPLAWDQIQTKYQTSSEKLAKLIQSEINTLRRPPDTRVQGAPLLVLEGADMPAVAIEVGNLSNPGDEKMLRDPEFLTRVARAVATAVDAFFAQKPK
jgi:N-acetylmuramoyl-L-alanine amidase